MLPVMAGEPEDKWLMVRFRDGQVAAFEELYARHKGPLYRYFLRQGCGGDRSAELVQEVWLKIIAAKDRYQPAAKFTTYLYRLAHHCFVDELRRTARRIEQPNGASACDVAELPAASGSDPQAGAMQAEATRRFRSALDALPSEQREAFILKQEAALSLAEIAFVTGVGVDTAKSRLRYAFDKLRRQLRDESGEP